MLLLVSSLRIWCVINFHQLQFYTSNRQLNLLHTFTFMYHTSVFCECLVFIPWASAQTLAHSFLNQYPSLVCKLAGVSYSYSSLWLDRTFRRLGTRADVLVDSITWVIGKPACKSSLLLLTSGSDSDCSMTYSRVESACHSVYYCTLIAYSFGGATGTPSTIRICAQIMYHMYPM